MSDVVVSVENVGKKFCRSLQKGMLYTSADVMRDMMGLRANTSELRAGEFWAVKDVSFELKRGESLGLIGHNGAGKSTLLKMLNGIIRPDTGAIRMKGRVGALIEVGAGFHPMLSGRENIYINGAILGMNKREIDRKFDQIVEFSGLAPDVLDSPVKSYSSGMYVRLGFAVAAHCDPDILLIDEVLAVGDTPFIGKCRKRIAELRKNGTTIILVTHQLPLMETNCALGICMDAGRIITSGTSVQAATSYRSLTSKNERQEWRKGEVGRIREAEITGLRLRSHGSVTTSMVSGSKALMEIDFLSRRPIEHGNLVIWILRELDGLIFGETWLTLSKDLPSLTTSPIRLVLDMTPNPGVYTVGASIVIDDQLIAEYQVRSVEVTVGAWNSKSSGPAGLIPVSLTCNFN